jgi:hypothetical protein
MEEALEQNTGVQREPLRRPVRSYGRQKEVYHRIKIWMAYCLIVFAIMIDLAELATTYIGVVVIGGILSNLIAIFATTVFWIWFLILGVPYSANTKRFGVVVVTHVAEYIPVADAIPFWFMWTIGMATTIGMVRMEDKGEKPTIIGGILEILSTTSPSPVTFVLGIPRRIQRRLGVGQADWVKQQKKEEQNPSPVNTNLKQMKSPQSARPTKNNTNVLDLKKVA